MFEKITLFYSVIHASLCAFFLLGNVLLKILQNVQGLVVLKGALINC